MSFWPGSMANIQVYTTGLTQAQLFTLWEEGIGGAPVDLPYLFAWYPLNGNDNDYSGDNLGGSPQNVSYSSAWSNYQQP
jgi:hypothetical protein